MPPTPVAKLQRRETRWLVALMVTAFVLRAAVLWIGADRLEDDRDHYRRIAERIVAGDGFADPNTGSPTAYRPPLYPWLLAALIFCGGGSVTIGIFQLLLGLATVWLTVACAWRLQLERGALLAGWMVAVDPLLLYSTGLVMTEASAAFLAALLLWTSLHPAAPRRDFCLGLVFGLACLCRPTFWAAGVLAALGWLALSRQAGGDRLPAAWVRRRTAALIAAGALVALLPWTIRNAFAMGRPIVTTTHGGYTLLLAHNPGYTQAVVNQAWGNVWEGPAFDAWARSLEAELANLNPPLDAAHPSPPQQNWPATTG
jgi:Dolichyl-phosphate-mannose-protein mannosyltransferase